MFNSQFILSRKGPLGVIWVAAYCFKRLRKAQVFETDISFSVDKILQDEFDVLTYRVLAYLLLGVVRIYSRKVDYLLDECNEVIVKINEFVAEEKHKVERETPRGPFFSITLPESFELDAFDLEIHDDANLYNVMPQELITLKDVAWKTNMGQYSLERNWYEEFPACTDALDYSPTGYGLSSHLMDIDTDVRTSHNLIDQEAHMEKLSFDKCLNGEDLKPNMFGEVDEEPKEADRSYGEGHQVDEQHMDVAGMAGPKKLVGRDPNDEKDGDRFSKECVDLHGEKALIEEMRSADVGQEEKHMFQVVEEEVDAVNLETSVEKLMQNDISHIDFVETTRLVMPSTEENDTAKQPKLPEMESPEGRVHSPIDFVEPPQLPTPFTEENDTARELTLPEIESPDKRVRENIQESYPPSITTDATPESKPGTSAATPEFMFIPTPAPKEQSRFPRKRKCLFDDIIVLPNHILKKWLDDSSDLLHKRRKGAYNALAARRISRISNLSRGFAEPLVPCGLELISLFFREKSGIPKFTGTVKPMQLLVTPEPPLDGGPLEPKGAALLEPPVHLESVETVEPPENLGMPESSRTGSYLEPTEIAPQTPVQHSVSVRPFVSPENPKQHNLDGGEPFHLTEYVGKEPSHSTAEQELELGLLHEDINLWEEHRQDQDSSGDVDGWSARTRIVADYLSRVLLHLGKRGMEKANILQLLEGRTKKESARFFYEILVLRSKGFIDVSQADAYGDILVWKVHKETKPNAD